jgi:hypothetical protein
MCSGFRNHGSTASTTRVVLGLPEAEFDDVLRSSMQNRLKHLREARRRFRDGDMP